jgi:hypothetical protein
MTVKYRNKTAKNVGTSQVVICTVPEGEQYLIAGLTLANTVGSTVFADITLRSAEDNQEVYIIKRGKIPVAMTMVPVANETSITLEAGDQLKINSSIANSIDVVLTYLSLEP